MAVGDRFVCGIKSNSVDIWKSIARGDWIGFKPLIAGRKKTTHDLADYLVDPAQQQSVCLYLQWRHERKSTDIFNSSRSTDDRVNRLIYLSEKHIPPRDC